MFWLVLYQSHALLSDSAWIRFFCICFDSLRWFGSLLYVWGWRSRWVGCLLWNLFCPFFIILICTFQCWPCFAGHVVGVWRGPAVAGREKAARGYRITFATRRATGSVRFCFLLLDHRRRLLFPNLSSVIETQNGHFQSVDTVDHRRGIWNDTESSKLIGAFHVVELFVNTRLCIPLCQSFSQEFGLSLH